MLSFPMDSANKWAKPVRPFQGALPALRLALPSMKSVYSTTFSICVAFTTLYLILVLGNINGLLSRWRAKLELAADKRKQSPALDDSDDSLADDTEDTSANVSSRLSAGFVKHLQAVVQVVVLLGTIVFLPGIVQTFVVAFDCSRDNNTTETASFVWDRDPTVECFVGDHAAGYANPSFVLLPLYLFAALRLSKRSFVLVLHIVCRTGAVSFGQFRFYPIETDHISVYRIRWRYI